jgi:hypothetical protein
MLSVFVDNKKQNAFAENKRQNSFADNKDDQPPDL